jgi:5-methylcytosine-specific restriction endonuclease McrA
MIYDDSLSSRQHQAIKNESVSGEDRKKICAKCGREKSIYKDISKKCGFSAKCKHCQTLNAAAWRAANQEKVKAIARTFRELHSNKVKSEKAKYYADNKEKIKLSQLNWRVKNKDELKISQAAYRSLNAEKINNRQANYYAKNKEMCDATISAWRKRNPFLVRIYWQNRESRKRENGGALSIGIIEKLFHLQKGKCACCRAKLGDDFHLDHMIPLSKGGKNSDENMQLLTATCNMKKGSKDPIKFMQQKGYLL